MTRKNGSAKSPGMPKICSAPWSFSAWSRASPSLTGRASLPWRADALGRDGGRTRWRRVAGRGAANGRGRSAAPGHGRGLLQERPPAPAIVGGAPRLSLEVALQVELAVKVVRGGGVQGSLDQAEALGRAGR